MLPAPYKTKYYESLYVRSNYNKKFTPLLIIKLYKTIEKVPNTIPKPKILNSFVGHPDKPKFGLQSPEKTWVECTNEKVLLST